MGRQKTQVGTCEIAGCERPQKAKGMCSKHYLSNYLKAHPGKQNDGPTRGHHLYGVWFDRKQQGSLCPEWKADFWAFAAAVGDRPSKTHLLRPLRYGEPYGPDNFEWLAALKREPSETRKAFNARKWQSRRERFPQYEAHRSIKRKYGITPAEYAEMAKAQGFVCAICGLPESAIDAKTQAPKQLAVDHCHVTKMVRGLLCWRCNTTLGKVADSTALLEKMIAYLRARSEPEDVI